MEYKHRGLGITSVINALMKLTLRHDTQRKAVYREFRERLYRGYLTIQAVNDPVGVEQVQAHRRTDGRPGIRRRSYM